MKLKHIAVLVLSLIIVTFFFGRLSTFGERKSQNQTILALTDTLTTTRVIIGGITQTLSRKSTIILTKQLAVEAGLLEIDRLRALNFKNVSHLVRVEARLEAARDSIPVVFPVARSHDSIPPQIVSAGEAKNTMPIPAEFYFESKYFNLTAGFDENMLGYFDANAPTPITVTIGSKKTGLWKTTPTVAVTTPSPYLIVTDITPIDLRGAKKWWEKPLVIGGIGVVAGVITGVVLSQ